MYEENADRGRMDGHTILFLEKRRKLDAFNRKMKLAERRGRGGSVEISAHGVEPRVPRFEPASPRLPHCRRKISCAGLQSVRRH